jgi:enamine deaminase RidA (YjgF/YER057c/UK114 family)
MKREIIETEGAPRLLLPFSQAVKLGSLVFVSGQGPIDPKTHAVNGVCSWKALHCLGARALRKIWKIFKNWLY